MKKIVILLVAVVSYFTCDAYTAQNSTEGPVLDAGIGVGIYDKGEGSGAMFTQRVGVQWPLADFGNNLSLSAGAYINNSFGASTGIIEPLWQGKEIDELDVKYTRDDVSFLPTVSLNYSFSTSVEAYLSLGVGIGILNAKASVDFDGEDPDDYVGLDGFGKTNTEACFAMSSCIGIRYYVNDSWAVNAQVGMLAGNLKSHAGSFNLASVGVSYQF